ncbi:hypothetical protein Sme01_19980 [Sphaerisporangium melleum]|uniref:Mersacidin/lichenicidin family type 2 lantibiotic n=1 Tax=Sphaerisporangium melleum TaxID=321316 RepID=A0A917VSG8_9ACTN|nr:hypothetical protein [Sphaerisporangium melleum]GGL13260.1 hypothetical protein GCM10007964_64210 [Sphaerisporangium melleum]GII69522.1 hypothetical protein Sme01_19980 [Sphaerisporangium melleum]
MSDDELIRQWKDPRSRAGGAGHPAGEIDLDEHIARVVGGMPQETWPPVISHKCCTLEIC